ncbi:MAG: iron-sulfur cluster assembly protein, partial [Chloroflexales bacterium]
MGLFPHGAQLTEQQVLAALSHVQEPELGGDIVARRMVKSVQLDGPNVRCVIE